MMDKNNNNNINTNEVHYLAKMYLSIITKKNLVFATKGKILDYLIFVENCERFIFNASDVLIVGKIPHSNSDKINNAVDSSPIFSKTIFFVIILFVIFYFLIAE